MKMFRKNISVLLAVMMLISLFAFSSSAQEECVHSYTGSYVAPNCVESSYTLYVCSLCGNNYKDYTNSVAALGHNYGAWYDIDEATCEFEGHIKRDCTRCSAAEIKTIAALEHTDANYNGKCDICDIEMEVEFKFSPYDWFVALFKAIAQWFSEIFA